MIETGYKIFDFDNGFTFSFGWADKLGIGDIIHFEKERGHPFNDCFTGTPKTVQNDDGSISYVKDDSGNIVREFTTELSAEYIWILKRTDDRTWTYEQTLNLPAEVLYKLLLELAKEQHEKLKEADKSEPSKGGHKRNTRKESQGNTNGKA